MEPLDFTIAPPRGAREKLLGLTFLPRTIDKMRANLPGGNLNGYLIDLPDGFSTYLLKKIGVDQAALQAVVASATSEAEVVAWISAHADLSDVEGLNAKLAAMTRTRISEEAQARVLVVHPGLDEHPELQTFYDIFDFDDARVAAAQT
jgi:hypothetical protein